MSGSTTEDTASEGHEPSLALNDHFFSMGGDSLAAVRVITLIEEAFVMTPKSWFSRQWALFVFYAFAECKPFTIV